MLPNGMSINEFQPLDMLDAEMGATAILGINFNDTTQGAKMDMHWETETGARKQTVTFNPKIGELIRPVTMSESLFMAEQGENSSSLGPSLLKGKGNKNFVACSLV